ncbi:MAG: hypothetical protein KDK04_29730, partial [Candidatus Competibacteraceae bacterium]|nr:hypothetical protein [Candidatus Competibacteraceae bacterium]
MPTPDRSGGLYLLQYGKRGCYHIIFAITTITIPMTHKELFSMQTKAAVLYQANTPLVIEHIE